MKMKFCFIVPLLILQFACILNDGELAAAEFYGEIVVLQSGKPLGLTCNATTAGGPIQWFKDNVRIENNGSTLVITEAVEASFGNYTCKYVNSTEILTTYQVIPEPVVEFSSKDPPSVEQGRKLQLTCVMSNIYGPNITWIFCGKAYQQSAGRITISKDKNTGVERAVLVVEDLKTDEFCNITCKVHFPKITGGVDVEVTTHVREAVPLTTLYQFIIIFVPLFIICLLILLRISKEI